MNTMKIYEYHTNRTKKLSKEFRGCDLMLLEVRSLKMPSLTEIHPHQNSVRTLTWASCRPQNSDANLLLLGFSFFSLDLLFFSLGLSLLSEQSEEGGVSLTPFYNYPVIYLIFSVSSSSFSFLFFFFCFLFIFKISTRAHKTSPKF